MLEILIKDMKHLRYQNVRDIQLMKGLSQLLNCGRVFTRSSGDAVDFHVSNFSDIIGKVLPFFKEYPLQGAKRKDFADFVKVAELMKNKAHLNFEGLEEIRKIRLGMNTGRDHTQSGTC
jgi:hypothetical protein